MPSVYAYLDLSFHYEGGKGTSYMPIGEEGNPLICRDFEREDGQPLAQTQPGDIILYRGMPVEVIVCKVTERNQMPGQLPAKIF